VEYHAEGDNNLEDPRFVYDIDRGGEITSQLLHEERGNNVQTNEQDDTQRGEAMEYPGKHWPSTLVFEPLQETNFSIETHGNSFLYNLRNVF